MQNDLTGIKYNEFAVLNFYLQETICDEAFVTGNVYLFVFCRKGENTKHFTLETPYRHFLFISRISLAHSIKMIASVQRRKAQFRLQRVGKMTRECDAMDIRRRLEPGMVDKKLISRHPRTPICRLMRGNDVTRAGQIVHSDSIFFAHTPEV